MMIFSAKNPSEFVMGMKNANTTKKTEQSHRQFMRWKEHKYGNDEREIREIPHPELDPMISEFLLAIKKADGGEYEPDTLTSYHRGLDRCLREHNYTSSITEDKEFASSRAVLAAKRKQLKGKGKGNRPNTAEPLTASEANILRERGCTGIRSPQQHSPQPGSDLWYKSQPLGENSLRKIMKKMADKAGLPGRKTNHSARKTTFTKLLHAGVAPTTIQQLTGHKNA